MQYPYLSVIYICGLLCLAPFMGNHVAAQETDGDEAFALSSMANETKNTGYGLPNGGKTVFMARADWDTGWFQAEIFKILLTMSGYTVKGPITMTSRDFFLAAARSRKNIWKEISM